MLSVLIRHTFCTQPAVAKCYVIALYLLCHLEQYWILIRKIFIENCSAFYWLQLRGKWKKLHTTLRYMNLY